MHAFGLVLVLLASLQSTPPEGTPRNYTNVVAQEPERRLQFVPPDRHESANAPRYFVCPKDGAMLRVPGGTSGEAFKCPVDGTDMKSGVGMNKKFFLLDE